MIYWISSKNRFPFYMSWCCSLAQSCPTLCNSMDCSTPGFPVLHISQSLEHNQSTGIVILGFSIQFSSVQSLSHVQLFVTPWIAARQASLFITISQSSLRPVSIESVMPSSHLILSSPSPPAPNPSQHQGLFQWVNSLHEVAKVLEFQL